jgi:hypothetical protein
VKTKRFFCHKGNVGERCNTQTLNGLNHQPWQQLHTRRAGAHPKTRRHKGKRGRLLTSQRVEMDEFIQRYLPQLAPPPAPLLQQHVGSRHLFAWAMSLLGTAVTLGLTLLFFIWQRETRKRLRDGKLDVVVERNPENAMNGGDSG